MPVEEISAENIIKKYNNGMSLPNIAKHLKTDKNTIIRYLINDGGDEGKIIVLLYLDSRKPAKVSIMELVQKYQDGFSIEQIADEYDIKQIATIVDKLKIYENIFGITIVERQPPACRRLDVDLAVNDIIQEYKDGEILEKIADDYNCAAGTISIRLKEHKKKTGEDVKEIHRENSRKKRNKNKKTNKDKPKGDKANPQTPKLKVASLKSVCEIIKQYGYSFDKISQEAETRGYIVLSETYLKAFEIVRRQKKAKETEGTEVEY